MKNIAIRCEQLSKQYTIKSSAGGHQGKLWGIRELFLAATGRNKKETFYALKDFTVEIGEGEIVGIIGRNGAGKSTLLHLLSEITPPTSGFAEIRKKVASFVDIGMGFHPDLSGRDNIYISGALLGLKKQEVEKKIDSIIEFSGIQKFIDTPVKFYSKGMYVRLAFSIVAFLDADIYLFDEVLVFGDAEFRKKCLRKISELIKSKKTVLLVTHNLNEIMLCNKVLYLEKGHLKAQGTPLEILTEYIDDIFAMLRDKRKVAATSEISAEDKNKETEKTVEIVSFNAVPKNSEREICYPDDEIKIEIEYKLNVNRPLHINMLVNDYNDYPLFVASTLLTKDIRMPETASNSNIKATCLLPAHLLGSGTFILRFNFIDASEMKIFDVDDVFTIKVEEPDFNGAFNWHKLIPRPIRPEHKWEILT